MIKALFLKVQNLESYFMVAKLRKKHKTDRPKRPIYRGYKFGV